MGIVVVANDVTLDGMMQAPARPDQDTRDGFSHGGWAAPRAADEQIATKIGERMGAERAFLFGRRTYENLSAVGKRVGVLALILAVAGVCASSASAFHGHHVYVANRFCNGHQRKPAKIEIACGTGEFYAAGLLYSSYGQRKANALGTLWLDDCTPNCALGTFRAYPGRVTLRHIVQCRQRYYYGVIRWRFTGTPPPGVAASGGQSIQPQMMACSPVS